MEIDETSPDPDHPGLDHLRELVVAAEMDALEVPYVVVCTRVDAALSYIQGPYPDGISALRDSIAMQDSPDREADARFFVAPLWAP